VPQVFGAFFLKQKIMNKLVIILLLTISTILIFCKSQKKAKLKFENYPVYKGEDLGVTYSKTETILKLWSPTAEAVKLKLYKTSSGNNLIEEHDCKKVENGVWEIELKGDYKDKYYTFKAKFDGKWNNENPDPYAKAVGVNGKRGMIVDLTETDPDGWDKDKNPEFENPVDAIIYELHIRDLSTHKSSGIKYKGKFLAFTEENTKNPTGLSTGIDHIAELGVTHVHLLPAFDYLSIDESKLDENKFNWGYAPLNYNTPEGSYSTNPEDGKVRIREFKQMVQTLHNKGIRVVMDVVYNHTGLTHDSNFDQLVPGYYYRQREDGKYSDAAACNNEVASERAMVRKFIVESVKYWAKEYHIDGFRFDLMAIHDIETMNAVSSELKKIDPTILIYGEGWTAGDSPLPVEKRALKIHAGKLNDIAVFSDDIRDGIRGYIFSDDSAGFVNGSKIMDETIKFSVVAAGEHPQIDYSKCYYEKKAYTNNPASIVNYVSCHDNNTLYDKLKLSRPDASEEDLIKMSKLANTIVFTSQGIAFMHAGVEMKRTKGGEHNSFDKPDSINQINWNWKTENIELFNYYKNLVKLRKSHPAFRMTTNRDVQKHLKFIEVKDNQLVAFQISDNANGDEWRNILVIFNGADKEKEFLLPEGKWTAALINYKFTKESKKVSGKINLSPISATILHQE
jgi:pullulanase